MDIKTHCRLNGTETAVSALLTCMFGKLAMSLLQKARVARSGWPLAVIMTHGTRSKNRSWVRAYVLEQHSVSIDKCFPIDSMCPYRSHTHTHVVNMSCMPSTTI